MTPAIWPRAHPDRERLIVLDAGRETLVESKVGDLAGALEPGDSLIVNDAAVLPASIQTELASGEALELRLFDLDVEAGRARALVFGPGSWRTPTEKRPPPPALSAGDRIAIGATIDRFDDERFVDLRFDVQGAKLLERLYRAGRPVQYSYLAGPLDLWHVQSVFASRPWSVEMPSAGRPLTWETLFALRRRGIRIGSLTHAAGLSSTGRDDLDRKLPFAERYEIPERTAKLVVSTRDEGGRVIAVGTTVVRALESSFAAHGRVVSGRGLARLRLSATHRLRAVDGILTGLHEAGTSHFELLESFAPRVLLERAVRRAEERGYLGHEFGDSCSSFRALGRSGSRRDIVRSP